MHAVIDQLPCLYQATAFTRINAAVLIKFYDFFNAALIPEQCLLKLIERNDSG